MSRIKDFRETITLSLPVAASYVSDMRTVAVDSIMVGSLGTASLAAVTLAGSSTMIVMLFGIGFTVAITPMAAASWARGDHAHVAGVARTGTRITIVVSLALVAMLLSLSPFLSILGAPDDVTQIATPFFRWLVLSFLFRLAFGAFKQTTEALGNTRLPMMIALGANVLNVFLNWVFIWGNLGAPTMGVEGAGFATFLSRVAAAAVAFWAWRRFAYFAPLRNHATSRASRGDRKLLFTSGASIGLQITLEVLAFAAGAIMIGWIGATQLAAHQIALNLASITFMIALGLSTAATLRLASAAGRKDMPGLRRAASSAILLVIAYELIAVTAFVTLRFWLPSLYVADPAVIALSAHLLLYAAAFQLFDGMQAVGMGLLRGMNDTRIPTIIAFSSYTIVAMPVGYVCAFPFGMGPAGIWVGYLTGLITASVGYFLRYQSQMKKGLA